MKEGCRRLRLAQQHQSSSEGFLGGEKSPFHSEPLNERYGLFTAVMSVNPWTPESTALWGPNEFGLCADSKHAAMLALSTSCRACEDIHPSRLLPPCCILSGQRTNPARRASRMCANRCL